MSDIIEYPIKNFLGLNLQDAADKVQDNEFTLLQNVYQPSKGVLYPRFGSVADVSSFPLCSRVSGVWRHYGQSENISLYHCVPDNSALPDNTVDLTLTDLPSSGGTIFNGGSVVTIRVCYEWFGSGLEQTYNTKSRVGYVSATNTNAWSQTGHQSITLSTTSSSLKVTIPSTFPTGVRGANIFVAVGTSTQMVFVGSVTTPGGNITFKRFIGPVAAVADSFTGSITATPGASGTGNIQPGTYYVSAAWMCDNGIAENAFPQGGPAMGVYTTIKTVVITQVNSSIQISHNFSTSTNGAKNVYLFIGSQPVTLAPHSFVGVAGPSDSVTVTAIPKTNAQTHPIFGGFVGFYNCCYSAPGTVNERFGFILAKAKGGSLYEVFVSRTLIFYGISQPDDPVNGGAVQVGPPYYLGGIRTQNDNYNFAQPYNWGVTVLDPMFCYLLGLSYFVNGADITWLTDGHTLGQIVPIKAATQTLLPPPLRYIFTYQNGLIGTPSIGSNQVFASNANAPQNWATGGTGSLLRFITIGDALGSGVSAMGTFTPATEATSNPGSFLISFKKNGSWMISTIPDPTSSAIAGLIGGQIGSPMTQISGRVGCVAYRSVVNTPLGTMFVGQDGNVYIIAQVSEPRRIGTKVQNGLAHLVGNDTAMQCVTAVYHDNHYKISYPSPTAIKSTPIINDSEIWADLRTETGPITWSGPHTGRNIGPQVVLVGDNDDMSRLVCDASLVRTYTADSTTSLADLDSSGNPQTITCKIKSKIFRFNGEAHDKRYFGAEIDAYIDYSYNNTILFEGFADSYYQDVNKPISSGGAVWDSSQWDSGTFADASWEGYSLLFGQTNLIGRTFQWALTKADQSPFALSSVTLFMKAEKRRKIS